MKRVLNLLKAILLKNGVVLNSNKSPFDVYIALVLDSESRKALREKFPATHKKEYYHHMTIAYKPNLEVYKKYRDYINKNIVLDIIGQCSDEKGQAVLVKTNLSENLSPHITLSCREDTDAVYSNELLEKGVYCIDGKIRVRGKVKILLL